MTPWSPTLLPQRPRVLSPVRNRIPRLLDTASYFPGLCGLCRLLPKVSYKPCWMSLTLGPPPPRHSVPTRPNVSNRYPAPRHMFLAPPPHWLTQEEYRAEASLRTTLYNTCFRSIH